MRTYLPSFPFFHPIYSFVFVSPYSPLSLPLPSSVSLLADSIFCFPSICSFLNFSYSGFNSLCPCSQLFFFSSFAYLFLLSLSFLFTFTSLTNTFLSSFFLPPHVHFITVFFLCFLSSTPPPQFCSSPFLLSLSFPLFFTISPFFRHMVSPLPLSPPPHHSFPLPSPLRLPFPPLAFLSSSSPSSSSAS